MSEYNEIVSDRRIESKLDTISDHPGVPYDLVKDKNDGFYNVSLLMSFKITWNCIA